MKKILALVLALIMVFALIACGETKPEKEETPKDTTPAASGDTAKGDFTASSGYALTLDSVKSTGEKYKIAYVGFAWDNSVEHFANAAGKVFKALGCEYVSISSESNADTFINNIEQYISQGYDGLICNTYSVTEGRASEILAEAKMPWMPGTSGAYDYDGNISAPFVAVDDNYVGHTLMDEALAWAKANWSDFDEKNCYVYIIDVSTGTELHNRCMAMEEEAKAIMPNAYKIEVGDSIAEGGGFSPEVAYNMCVRTFAANPDVQYWIVLHPFDYYCTGTCRAAEDYNIVDRVCNVCCNGDNYLPILQDGTSGCWRFCLYWDNGLWGYLQALGLYSIVSGACTAETLWSDCIPEGSKYPVLPMASVVMGPDNFKDVLGFYDNYIGDNFFGYKDDWSGKAYDVLNMQ